MSAMASQITGVSSVCSTICSGADQRKHQSSASLAFARGIHLCPVDSLHKAPVTRKMFPFDDFIMALDCLHMHLLFSKKYDMIWISLSFAISTRNIPGDLGQIPWQLSPWLLALPSHQLTEWYWLRKHDDVIKWKHFPRNWPFVREIQWSPVNFPYQGQWRGALMFSLIYAWINDWVNNREAGDLRRQHGHYDVIVMFSWHFNIMHPIDDQEKCKMQVQTYSPFRLTTELIYFKFERCEYQNDWVWI